MYKKVLSVIFFKYFIFFLYTDSIIVLIRINKKKYSKMYQWKFLSEVVARTKLKETTPERILCLYANYK